MDEDRRAILDRRARLIALALSGLAPGCYESHIAEPPVAPIVDAGHAIDSGVPVPCLGVPLPEDAGFDAGAPQPCLEAPFDAGHEAVADAGDAGPLPCLS